MSTRINVREGIGGGYRRGVHEYFAHHRHPDVSEAVVGRFDEGFLEGKHSVWLCFDDYGASVILHSQEFDPGEFSIGDWKSA